MPTYKALVRIQQAAQDIVEERLIKAKTRAQALTHVCDQSITVTLASDEELVELGAQGIKLENAL